jgi:hypothetical protein
MTLRPVLFTAEAQSQYTNWVKFPEARHGSALQLRFCPRSKDHGTGPFLCHNLLIDSAMAHSTAKGVVTWSKEWNKPGTIDVTLWPSKTLDFDHLCCHLCQWCQNRCAPLTLIRRHRGMFGQTGSWFCEPHELENHLQTMEKPWKNVQKRPRNICQDFGKDLVSTPTLSSVASPGVESESEKPRLFNHFWITKIIDNSLTLWQNW